MKTFLPAVLVTVALAASTQVLAQAFPAKPLSVITSFTAGSSGDTTARVIAAEVSRMIGQPVVIEGRPGAGGLVSAVNVARAAPDGYTLLIATAGFMTIQKYLVKSIELDPLEALTPVTRIGSPITTFVVGEKVPVATMKEFIEHARSNPGKVTYGHGGIGSPHHFSGEQMALLTGARFIQVPYKAVSTALLDTVTGQIASTFSIYSVTVPHIQSGKVRVLAVVGAQRSPKLPDVPTMAEIVPGFEEPPAGTGIYAPKATPPAVVQQLSDVFRKAMSVPGVIEKLDAGGMVLYPSSPEQLAAELRQQSAMVQKIVNAVGMKPR